MWEVDQVLGLLPLTWETQMDLPAADLDLALPGLLQAFGESISGLVDCSLFFCCSALQVGENKF